MGKSEKLVIESELRNSATLIDTDQQHQATVPYTGGHRPRKAMCSLIKLHERVSWTLLYLLLVVLHRQRILSPLGAIVDHDTLLHSSTA